MESTKKSGAKTVLKVFATILFAAVSASLIFGFWLFLSDWFAALFDGKYSIPLGIIPLFIVFIASVTLFIIIMFREKIKMSLIFICAAVIILIIPYFTIVNYVLSIPYRTFSVQMWHDNFEFRYFMIDDFEKKYNIVGTDVDEVEKILGKNVNAFLDDYDYIEYDVGNDFVFRKKYRIYFDADRKVTKTELIGV